MSKWRSSAHTDGSQRPERDTDLDLYSDTMIHIPTPGDHYSPATGSAIMTIIYELARVHQADGGRTQVIVSRGTRHDYPVGQCIEVDATVPPRKWQKTIDIAAGRAGLSRRYSSAVYRPHVEAIPGDFEGPVFIHNNPAPLPMFRERLPKATLCLWAHNELFGTYRDGELQRVLEACDVFIGCSDFICRGVRQRCPNATTPIVTVHSGVDTHRFTPAVDRPPRDEPVVLFVGRMQPQKGPDLLIRAAIQMLEAGLNFRLRLVGSQGFDAGDPLSPFEQKLRDLARPLGDRVEFLPFTDRHRLPEVYRDADILCVPSNWDEPLGLVVLEGMASGLPTVASRRGGIPEIGGEAVRYFDTTDVAILADAVSIMVRDSQQRTNAGRAARSRAESLDWNACYRRLLQTLTNSRGEAFTAA